MTFRTFTSPSTKPKSNFAFSKNSFLASSETFVPITKSCDSFGERVPETKIVTPSTSYLIEQNGRRSDIRQKFIGRRDIYKALLAGTSSKNCIQFLIFLAIKRILVKLVNIIYLFVYFLFTFLHLFVNTDMALILVVVVVVLCLLSTHVLCVNLASVIVTKPFYVTYVRTGHI